MQNVIHRVSTTGRSLDDHPSQLQFEYCISYNDGQPTLQVISYVRKYVYVCIVQINVALI